MLNDSEAGDSGGNRMEKNSHWTATVEKVVTSDLEESN